MKLAQNLPNAEKAQSHGFSGLKQTPDVTSIGVSTFSSLKCAELQIRLRTYQITASKGDIIGGLIEHYSDGMHDDELLEIIQKYICTQKGK